MGRGIDPGALFRSPLLLVTLIIGFVAWFVAFIGMCVGEAKYNVPNSTAPLYGVEWFAIWVQILVTVFFCITCTNSSIGAYRIQLAVFIAICIVFSVHGVQNIYVKGFGASTATGVGWLLICIVDIIWLLYLTSDEGTWLYDTFTTSGHPGWAGGLGARHSGRVSRAERGDGSESSALRMNGADRGMTSHDIPTAGYAGVTGGYGGYPSGGGTTGYAGGGGSPLGTPMSKVSSNARGGDDFGAPGYGSRPVSTEATKKAKANYAYSASPDDPNEVSFKKDDILEVIDTTGKWFQVRTPEGRTGIAPSNYLTLL